MSQLRHRHEELEAMGARAAAISFGRGKVLGHYASDLHIPFPILSDPDRTAYRAYGMRSGSTWDIFGAKTIWTYVKLIARGRLFRGVQADPYQLGGDFVIDGRGVVRLAHRSQDPTDRPSVDRLLEAIREAYGVS